MAVDASAAEGQASRTETATDRRRQGGWMFRGLHMANLLIIGASRGIGREAVKNALHNNHSVTAFSRNPDVALQHNRLQHAVGDARNSAAVLAAMPGVDAVILSLGIKPSLRPTLKPVSLFSSGTRSVLAAMAEAGVRRLVAITGIGASESRSAIPLIARPAFDLALASAYDNKGRQERLIANSDTDWTIVRPGILMNMPASKNFQVLQDPLAWRPGLTSRADAAAFAVECATSRAHLLKAPLLLTRSMGCKR